MTTPFSTPCVVLLLGASVLAAAAAGADDIPTRESSRTSLARAYSSVPADIAPPSSFRGQNVSSLMATWFSPIGERGAPFEYTLWQGAEFPPVGGTMEVWFNDSPEPGYVAPNWGGDPTVYGVPPGTDYLVRLRTDAGIVAVAYGVTIGIGFSGTAIDVGVPVPDMGVLGLGLPQRTFTADDSPKGYAGVLIAPTFANDPSGRGFHLARNVAIPSGQAPGAWMRVEFLEGNTRFGEPPQTFRIPTAAWRSTPVAFYWDGSPRLSDRTWNVEGAIPDGPTRFHLSLDGYTTATLEADVIPGTHVWWYPVQAPLVASETTPSPAYLNTGGEPDEWIVRRARAWRDAGVATEFSNLAPYLDDAEPAGPPTGAGQPDFFVVGETRGLATFSGHFYDPTKEAGLAPGQSDLGKADAYYRGSEFEYTFIAGFGYYEWFDHPSGAQYLYLLRPDIPGVAPVAAYTALGADHGKQGGPSLTFPLDNDFQGRELGSWSSPSPDVQYTGLSIASFSGVSYLEPGLYLVGLDINRNPTRVVTVRSEFLPGNSLFPAPDSERTVVGANTSQSFSWLWWHPPQPDNPPTSYRLPAPIPYGPMESHYSVVGTTTDSLLWTGVSDGGTYWRALLIPDPPDFEMRSPDTLSAIGLNPPDPAIVTRALEWLLSGRVWHISNIKPFADRNGDRVNDVADLVTLRIGGGAELLGQSSPAPAVARDRSPMEASLP
jgi:hypothetical protein